MELKLDKPKDLVDPCPECLPYMEHDDMACDHCDKKLLKADYWDKLARLRITLDPSKTYIFHEGKCYEVPEGCWAEVWNGNGGIADMSKLPEVK